MSPKVPDTFYVAAPKLNEFNILGLIGANSRLTQAELARRCDLSVAMVNNYMKSLCGKGLLEYHRRSIKTVTYHLTVLGRNWLESKEQELVREAVDLFSQTKDHIWKTILRHAGPVQTVVIYGCGHLAELTVLSLRSAGVTVLAVCDDDPVHLSQSLCGLPVQPYSKIGELRPDAVVIAGGVRAGETNGTWSFLAEQGTKVVRLVGAPSMASAFETPPEAWMPAAAEPEPSLVAD